MPFYPSLKSLPELRGWNWKDRCDAVRQAGLKPLLRWQVWAAMAVCSLLALWVLDMVLGSMAIRIHPDPFGVSMDYDAALHVALYTVLALLLAVCVPATLAWRMSYLWAMRPLIGGIFPDPDASAPGATAKFLAMHLIFLMLTVAWMVALDGAINSFDETPNARIAQVLAWPRAIPDSQNGFIAMAGISAPAGTDPLAAGSRWVAAVNNALRKGAEKFPEAPKGLAYVAYAAPSSPGQSDRRHPKNKWRRPCHYGRDECLAVIHAQRQSVEAWLKANHELLARYRALANFPAWQSAIRVGPAGAPVPPFADWSPMIRGQELALASALRAADAGKAEEALAMLEADMRFTRRMLAAQVSLIGKMIAATMVAHDLSALAELIESRPAALAPYWTRVSAMLAPLTPAEVSCGTAFRFEQRFYLSAVPITLSLDNLLQPGEKPPLLLRTPWAPLHYKKNAMTNLALHYMDVVIRKSEVRDTAFAPPLPKDALNPLQGLSPVTGFMHNQIGKTIAAVSFARPVAYVNKVRDVNALNNLVRLRLLIARDRIAKKDVPAYLASKGAPHNPETGKPFEWDAHTGLIYFRPSAETFRKYCPEDANKMGRTGLRVSAAAGAQ